MPPVLSRRSKKACFAENVKRQILGDDLLHFRVGGLDLVRIHRRVRVGEGLVHVGLLYWPQFRCRSS